MQIPMPETATKVPRLKIDLDTLLKAYRLMCTAKEMTLLFEEKKEITSRYVHATSRGHEAIQLAIGLQLLPHDFVSPYYRDDSILLAIGMKPYDCMLQLRAKADDPFSGGRTYYGHPSLRDADKPKIIHQSSSTGMQAIPTTGIAHGIKYLEQQGLKKYRRKKKGSNSSDLPPIVVCSLGDAAVTEGEVSEAFHNAALWQLPILYLVQDNGWDISATEKETRVQNALQYAMGFPGLEAVAVNGSDFIECFDTVGKIYRSIRKERRPFLLHAKVPLLNHHTSGVRMEWYRPESDLAEHHSRDPFPVLESELIRIGIGREVLDEISAKAARRVRRDLEKANAAREPSPENLFDHIFAPTTITEEKGNRNPSDGKEIVMVDAALHALDDMMKEFPEALLFGQDVGGELGGVFREAATLAKKYGSQRVFNTAIQEAYIIGSSVGMSAAGCKPVVEVQFADYIWPGVNQLFAEVSRSCYLSNGKWPVQTLIRVPIGAYGSGGPFHSSSVESAILTIKGLKVVYPSNAADMKGLFKSAFLDPNPVVMFEHKGLYWGKVPGSKEAKTIEPDSEYIIPLGKARLYLEADEDKIDSGESCVAITYGMGVHWAKNASMENFPGQVEILDLRTLEPIDWEMICESVSRHGKVLVLTEEQVRNSFAESLAGRISMEMFAALDAPVQIMGAENIPAIPMNSGLEAAMLPNAAKVADRIRQLLDW